LDTEDLLIDEGVVQNGAAVMIILDQYPEKGRKIQSTLFFDRQDGYPVPAPAGDRQCK
jgi:hypothetical protein